MIITDSCVFLHYPKTGTTFTRAALCSVYGIRYRWWNRLLGKIGAHTPLKELYHPKLYGNLPPTYRDQHGVYRQIPAVDRHKRIVSIVRNPLQKYVSSYAYGWWKRYPPFPEAQVKDIFPSFPELSFTEYYAMVNHPDVQEDRLSTPEARTLGSYTRLFLVFFAKDPDAATKAIVRGTPLSEVIPPVTFLHQERLSDNLCECLKSVGISETMAERVHACQSKNVGDTAKKSAIATNDIQSVAEKILSDESHLLSAFPEYADQMATALKTGDCAVSTVGCGQPRCVGTLGRVHATNQSGSGNQN